MSSSSSSSSRIVRLLYKSLLREARSLDLMLVPHSHPHPHQHHHLLNTPIMLTTTATIATTTTTATAVNINPKQAQQLATDFWRLMRYRQSNKEKEALSLFSDWNGLYALSTIPSSATTTSTSGGNAHFISCEQVLKSQFRAHANEINPKKIDFLIDDALAIMKDTQRFRQRALASLEKKSASASSIRSHSHIGTIPFPSSKEQRKIEENQNYQETEKSPSTSTDNSLEQQQLQKTEQESQSQSASPLKFKEDQPPKPSKRDSSQPSKRKLQKQSILKPKKPVNWDPFPQPTSDVVTRGIRVQASSKFIRNIFNEYIHAYRIRITNESKTKTVRLLNRHWVIVDQHGFTRHVKGEGVIGQQPEIPPLGGEFEYDSSVNLGTPTGTMHGTYQMEIVDGCDSDDVSGDSALTHNEQGKEIFNVEIGSFELHADTSRPLVS